MTGNKLLISSKPFSILPIGALIATFCTEAPYGFLICDGRTVSREEYPTLFSIIGTIYGSGDGSTTFTLPNITDKFIKGTTNPANIGQINTKAEVPNFKGSFTMGINSFSVPSPTVSGDFLYNLTPLGSGKANTSGGWGDTFTYGYDASRVSPAYQNNANTVKPNSIKLTYIIRAF